MTKAGSLKASRFRFMRGGYYVSTTSVLVRILHLIIKYKCYTINMSNILDMTTNISRRGGKNEI